MAPSPSTRPPGSQRNLSSLWTLSIHFQLTLHTQASAKETFSFIWSTPAIFSQKQNQRRTIFLWPSVAARARPSPTTRRTNGQLCLALS